ncbi:MAG: NAD-dependent epimerase/dehydratase family protein, partial [Nitrososphaerales archaeon]
MRSSDLSSGGAPSADTRILITGACGQIGTELTTALRARYGDANVVVTDLQPLPAHLTQCGPGERLDVTDRDALARVVQKYGINTIYHLAAILSATGEEKPRLAWSVNTG